MIEELIEWGRICICIWILSLIWICRLFFGILRYRLGCLFIRLFFLYGNLVIVGMLDFFYGILVCCFWGVLSEFVKIF